MVIGLVSIGIRALVMPIIMITFSEFTSLLVDRTRGEGVSSKTTPVLARKPPSMAYLVYIAKLENSYF